MPDLYNKPQFYYAYKGTKDFMFLMNKKEYTFDEIEHMINSYQIVNYINDMIIHISDGIEKVKRIDVSKHPRIDLSFIKPGFQDMGEFFNHNEKNVLNPVYHYFWEYMMNG